MSKITYPTKRAAMQAGEAALGVVGTYCVTPVEKADAKGPWALELGNCSLLAFAEAFLSADPGPDYRAFVSDEGLRAMARQAVAQAREQAT